MTPSSPLVNAHLYGDDYLSCNKVFEWFLRLKIGGIYTLLDKDPTIRSDPHHHFSIAETLFPKIPPTGRQ